MSRNVTWCLIRNILKNNNYIGIRCIPQKTITRSQHATKGYVPVVNENKSNIDYHEVKTYSQYLDENQSGFDAAVKALMTLLDVTKDNAIKVTSQWKILQFMSKKTIVKNFDLLRNAGVFKSTLRQNMYALADTPENIKSKIRSFKRIGLEVNYALPLFHLSALELSTLAKITTQDRIALPHYQNRIEYLAAKFKVDEKMICANLYRHPEILTYPIERIISITDLCLDEFKMNPEYLLNDLFIYNYSYENTKERLLRAQRTGIYPLKPWVARCAIGIIERAERKKEDWNRLCSSSTLEEHMSKILNCDIKYVKALTNHAPYIRGLCIVKLTSLLQYLVSVGYTVHDIYRASMILKSNEDTIRYKYNKWIASGLSQPHIGVLTLSSNNYERNRKKKITVERPDLVDS